MMKNRSLGADGGGSVSRARRSSARVRREESGRLGSSPRRGMRLAAAFSEAAASPVSASSNQTSWLSASAASTLGVRQGEPLFSRWTVPYR